MNTFKFPDITPPDSVHNLEAARDALDRANQQLLDAAVRQAALEKVGGGYACDLGRLIAIAVECDIDDIRAYAGNLRRKYIPPIQRAH